MQEPIVNRFVAAASEIASSDLYMTVKATMFTSPSANLNGVRCTAAFIDEIVEHQEKYIGLPLCADMTKLENGLYRNLGHCYNSRTGTFSSTMIGSFYKFEKAALSEDETALIGYARILKRNKKVCRAISELFAEGNLKFSFEITCGEYEKMDDGTIRIDASERNYLEGMAIVSMPACPDAVALELVAEITGIGKEAEPMTNEDKTKVAEKQPEKAAGEAAENTETAEKYVTETHVEHDRVSTYDTETGVSTDTTVTIEQSVSGPAVTAEDETTQQAGAVTAAKDEEDNKPIFNPDEVDATAPVAENAQPETNQNDNNNAQSENTQTQNDNPAEPGNDNPGEVVGSCGKKEKETAASDEDEKEKDPEEEPAEPEDDDEKKKENAELDAVVAELKEFVASLKAQNEELKQEIAEIKDHMTGKVVAEAQTDINPFIDNISLADTGYRLLQEKPKQSSYRLLN